MKKNLINWMIILMVAIISLCVSCSKDDDSPKDETVVSIVGTWRYDWGSSAVSFTAYTFNSDGSGFIYDKGNPGRPFTYIYDKQNNIITIINSPYDKETMFVSELTSNILVLDGEEYRRVDSI
jgi:hypothetical protein